MIDVHMAYCDKPVRPDLLFVSVGFCLGEVLAAKPGSKVKTISVSAEYRSTIRLPEIQHFYYNDLASDFDV